MFFDLSLEGPIIPFAVTRVKNLRRPYLQLENNIVRSLNVTLNRILFIKELLNQ